MKESAKPSAQPAKASARRRRADSAERAYAIIRRLVIDFRFRPDERINEVQLAARLNLSRTPIREALNRLASEGFFIVAPNRGFFFRALEIDDLMQLFELRGVIETGAFRLACTRWRDRELGELERFWEEAQQRYKCGDPDEILGLDESFHLRLAALSGNEEIVRSVEAVNARIRFIRRIQIERGHRNPAMMHDHSRLVAALRKRDAELGCKILHNHISMTFEDARVALKEAIFRAFKPENQSAPIAG